MSKIIQIKTPATTANLGTGFDFLGLALNLYNVMEFEETNGEDQEIGFGKVGDNLALYCFKKIIKKYSDKDIKIIIRLIENNIPIARGLGSSASAIVSGCVAANVMLGNKLNEEELIKEMVDIEGHPDNILPCYLGGMVSSIIDDKINYYKHKVNDELMFNVLIPKYQVKTEEARKILPKEYKLNEITSNASRALMLPMAFENGDVSLIKKVTADVIHEPFRKTLIKEWNLIEKTLENKEAKLNISGSGPTMLVITKNKEIINIIKELNLDLDIKELKYANQGCEVIKM